MHLYHSLVSQRAKHWYGFGVEVSPFPHHGPLEARQVRGRAELVADLTERLTARRVTALLGPRRYGKTSVLRRIADDLVQGGTSVVWVDLYEVASVSDLALRVDGALNEAVGPLRGRLSSIAASLDLNLGFLHLGFARRKDERPEPRAMLHVLLDALVAAALAHPTVIVFDEFPGIVRVDGGAGMLRTKLQHHFQEIGIVFAGSQPSLMQTMFADRTMPFYAQADLVTIAPFSAAAVTAIVDDGFRATDRDPGSLGAAIHSFAGGHPHRTMQVADSAWEAAPPGLAYDPQVWESAVSAVRANTDLGNEAVFSGFATSEKAVLRLLASGSTLFGSAADLFGLSRGSAQNARTNLLASGDIIATRIGHAVADPLLADWLRRRFPV